MNINKTALFAWLYCGVIVIATLLRIPYLLRNDTTPQNLPQGVSALLSLAAPIVLAGVGALIVSRQPRNTIGWLIMLPTPVIALDFVITAMIQGISTPPADPPLLLVAVVWFSNAGWLLLIFPLLFIALLFPNGSPPSPRWRWVVAYGIGLIVFFVGIAMFLREVGPDPTNYGVNWTIPNPIGFLPQETVDAIFFPWWGIGLGIFTILSAVSLFVRYRHAAAVEREQIKWLLYAAGLFAVFYVPSLLTRGEFQGLAADIFSLLLVIGILGFPIAIGIAILRYRLFDIDIIIRRTVTYAIVVALLIAVYFGSVILLQQVFAALTGARSEIITMLSTLAIAVLFIPLRNRVQNAIDKRFNRKKYDAQQVLAKFAQTVRDETDLEKLSAELLNVVNETMQPKRVSVWLKQEQGAKERT